MMAPRKKNTTQNYANNAADKLKNLMNDEKVNIDEKIFENIEINKGLNEALETLSKNKKILSNLINDALLNYGTEEIAKEYKKMKEQSSTN